VPVIAGGTSANTTQEDFWFRNDNGSLTTATYIGAQTSNQTINADTVFRIRIIAEENNAKTDPWAFQLYAQKNGSGGYTAVTTTRTDGLQYSDDANSIADGTTISTADFDLTYTGTPTDGEYDDAQSAAGTGTIGLNGTYTEIEFCLVINTGTGNVSNGDYWDLQMYSTGGSPLDGYNATPRVTATGVFVTSGASLNGVGSLTADAKLDAVSGAQLDGVGTITAMPASPVGLNQAHFRFRDDTTALNTDGGWLAALDTNPASIDMGVPFRVRVEIEENNGVAETHQYKMQFRVNAGTWTDLGVHLTNNPAVMTDFSSQFLNDDATTNLLSGSSETFTAGHALENDNLTTSDTLQNEHTEFEWALFMQRRYDTGQELDDGDTVDLRVVWSDGTLLDNYIKEMSFTVNYPAGLVGGCMCESPHALGPVEYNGTLFYFMEHTSTAGGVGNYIICLKSTDDGATWAEVDASNNPTTVDFESGDLQVDGTTVHLFSHHSTSVRYHTFNLSTETWGTTDEAVVTGITETDQAVAGVVLSNGDRWCFYRRTDATFESIKYKQYTSSAWQSEQTLDAEASTNFTWVSAVVGASNLTHVFYQEITNGTGNMYHRSLSSAGSLSAREAISTTGGTNNNNSKSITKPIYWDDAGDEKIMVVYRESTNNAFSRIITNDGTPGSAVSATDNGVNRAEGGSNMLSAQLCGDGAGNAYLVYSDITNEDLYLAAYQGGVWGVEALKLSGADAVIDFQQISYYTNSNGDVVLGYIYENDPAAGRDTGPIWFEQQILIPVSVKTKVGTFALNTGAGVQNISGVGFQPELILLFGNPLTADGIGVDFNFFLGAATSSTARGVVTLNDEDGVDPYDSTRSVENDQILALLDPGLTTYLAQGDFSSMDIDGFSINLGTAPATGYRITYLAIAGEDMTNVAVSSFAASTSPGNQSVSSLSFQPDAIMFVWDGDTLAGSPGNDSEINVGFALSSTNRATASIATDNGTSSGLTYKGAWSDGCLSEIYYVDGTLNGKADFVSFDTNGFTINWSTNTGSADDIMFIAFKGGSYGLGILDTQTGTGSFSETGLSFQPTGGIFVSTLATALSSIQSGLEWSFSAVDVDGNVVVAGGSSESGQNPSDADVFQDDASLYRNYDFNQTLEGQVDFTSWNGNGFTLNQTDADPTATKLIYFVIGGEAAGAKNSGAQLDGVGTITAVGSVTHSAQTALAGVGTLTASGTVTRWGATALDGVGTLTAAGSVTKTGATVLAGVGSITAQASVTHSAQSALAGVGSLTAVASVTHSAQTALAGVGTIIASGSSTKTGATALDGVGTLTATAGVTHSASTSLSATANITARPMPIPTTNLLYWLDMADPSELYATPGVKVSADGQTVYQIDDKSGNSNVANQATAGLRATYKTAIHNGLSMLLFDPVATTNYRGPFRDLSSDYNTNQGTIFAVVKQDGTNANNTVINVNVGGGNNQVTLHATYANNLYWDMGDYAGGGRIYGAQPAGWDDTTHIVTGLRSGSFGKIQVDGASITLTVDTYSDDFDPTVVDAYLYTLGANFPGNQINFDGYIGEVIFYKTALTPEQELQVLTYLSDKWNIDITVEAQTALAGVGSVTAVGSVTKTGVTALAGVGSLTAVASVTHSAQSALAGVGSLTAVASVTHSAQSALAGVGSVTAQASVTKSALATLSGVGTLATQATVVHSAITALAGVGTITATAQVAHSAQTALAGVGSLTATGSIQGEIRGKTVLAGVGSLTADAKLDAVSGTALAGVGSITAQASVTHFAQTALAGVGSLTATGSIVRGATAVLAGVGSITPAGTVTGGTAVNSGAQLDGVGTLTAVATVVHGAQTTVSGTGSVVARAEVVHSAQTALSGVGTITAQATLEGQVLGATVLAGVGSIVADAKLDAVSGTALAGVGSLTAQAGVVFVSGASLSGVGTLTAIGTIGKFGATALAGVGTITASGTRSVSAQATLAGVGSASASASLVLGARTSLDGQGDVTAGAVLTLGGVVILDGQGTLTPAGTVILAFTGLVGVTAGDRGLGLTVVDRDIDLDVEAR